MYHLSLTPTYIRITLYIYSLAISVYTHRYQSGQELPWEGASLGGAALSVAESKPVLPLAVCVHVHKYHCTTPA